MAMRDRVLTETQPVMPECVSLSYLFWTFLKIGSLSFGGFIALIAVVADTIVEKRKLLKQEDMLNCISLASLLPG
jgi:chromate transporter